MEYRLFEKIINSLEKHDETTSTAYKIGIDLLIASDPLNNVITILFDEYYGDYATDWLHWFCYENDFGRGSLTAHDENEEPICYSVKSLWEYLEKNKK